MVCRVYSWVAEAGLLRCKSAKSCSAVKLRPSALPRARSVSVGTLRSLLLSYRLLQCGVQHNGSIVFMKTLVVIVLHIKQDSGGFTNLKSLNLYVTSLS